MTTVNKVVNETTTETFINSAGAGFGGCVVGYYGSRNSFGGDRPAGERPGYINYKEIYFTKPQYFRGQLIRPSEKRVRMIYKLDPNYLPYKQEHSYTATYLDSQSRMPLAVKDFFGNWKNCGTAYILAASYFPSVSDPFSNSDQLALIGKLRERIAGSSFNAGVSLGESPQVLKMVTESTSKIFTAYRSIRSGDPLKAAKILFGTLQARKVNPKRVGRSARPIDVIRDTDGRSIGDVYLVTPPRGPKFLVQESDRATASNWLQLQYGWKPLLSDIHEGMVFVDHHLRYPTVHRVHAQRFAEGRMSGILSNLDYEHSTKIPIRVVSSRRLTATLTEVDVVRLSGLTDPLSIAWELVPYSFIVDWFIPIGDYLSARGLANSLKGTFVTNTRLIVEKVPGSSAIYSQTIDPVYNSRDWRCRQVRFSRSSPNSTLSIPQPEVVPLSKVVSWQRAANAVALMINANSRK